MTISKFTTLINTKTMQYPASLTDMSLAYPDISFPAEPDEELINRYGFYVVYSSEPPLADIVEEIAPVFDKKEQKWFQAWSTRSFNEQELNRKRDILRDEKLQELNRNAQARKDQGFEVTIKSHDDAGTDINITAALKFDNVNITLQMIRDVAEYTSDDEMQVTLVDNTEKWFKPADVTVLCQATMRKLYDFNRSVQRIENNLNNAKTLGEVQEIDVSLKNI